MRKLFLVLGVLAGSAGVGGAAPASASAAIDPALVQTVQYRAPGPDGYRGYEPRRFGRHEPFRRPFALRRDELRGRVFHNRPGFYPGRGF